MPQANLLVFHPDSGAPTMLAAMLRALGYDRVETASYNAVRELPARRPGLVLLGMDPVDPAPVQLISSLCRDDHAPPLVLLFTATPPRSLHRELLNRAAAVLRFPLPTDQLGAAISLAVDASGMPGPVARAAPVSSPWNPSSMAATAPADRPFVLPMSTTGSASCLPVPCYSAHVRSVPGNGVDGIRPLKEALEGPERAIILEALQACDWNRNETADSLQICRSTLYHKMRRYGLFDAEGAPAEAAAGVSRSSSSSRT
jgi:DNA-binding NtrC family response regulator